MNFPLMGQRVSNFLFTLVQISFLLSSDPHICVWYFCHGDCGSLKKYLKIRGGEEGERMPFITGKFYFSEFTGKFYLHTPIMKIINLNYD